MTTSQPNFLLLEDDELTARSLKRVLARVRGVHWARSATEGVRCLSERNEWCGFIFDIDLGDGSGLDVLTYARTIYPEVPALIVTGRLEPEFLKRAFNLHANYLCKPVERSDILQFSFEAISKQSPSKIST